jgi:hypothetical protein
MVHVRESMMTGAAMGLALLSMVCEPAPGRDVKLAIRPQRISAEAIRSYAASHDGQLPQTLAEVTEVPVPKDPMSGAAFRYTRTGAGAVLEPTAPDDSDAKGIIRCEITVKN